MSAVLLEMERLGLVGQIDLRKFCCFFRGLPFMQREGQRSPQPLYWGLPPQGRGFSLSCALCACVCGGVCFPGCFLCYYSSPMPHSAQIQKAQAAIHSPGSPPARLPPRGLCGQSPAAVCFQAGGAGGKKRFSNFLRSGSLSLWHLCASCQCVPIR